MLYSSSYNDVVFLDKPVKNNQITKNNLYNGKGITVNSAYNELFGTMRNSSLYPEFLITV